MIFFKHGCDSHLFKNECLMSHLTEWVDVHYINDTLNDSRK